MSQFRLLAVRPLIDCNTRYTKVLQKGKIYPFFQGYKFLNEDGLPVDIEDSIASVVLPENMISCLYDLTTADEHKLNVEISAVVGKNGSGKSTLIELLFGSIYLLSVAEDISEDSFEKLDKRIDKESELIKYFKEKWNAELEHWQIMAKDFDKFLKEGYAKKSFIELSGAYSRSEFLVSEFKGMMDSAINRKKGLEDRIQRVKDMADGFRVQLIYQYDKRVYCLTLLPEEEKPSIKLNLITHKGNVSKSDARLYNQDLPFSALMKSDFFYTIAINYSHYALNAKYVGNWIDTIFHKNDGYKVPLVVNPMRHDGNFDINREITLAKYRLISNLLVQSVFTDKKEVQLTEQLSVKSVTFKLNRKKVDSNLIRIDNGIQGKEREKNIIKDFFYVFFDDENFEKKLRERDQIVDLLLNYILKKIDDLKKYDGLGSFTLEDNGKFGKTREYFRTLKKEESHVTYKLKQVVYFLSQFVDENVKSPIKSWSSDIYNEKEVVFELDFEEISEWTGKDNLWNLISRLPPPIFDIDFILVDQNQETSQLSDLSSGEQQMINTIQTVLYHINNLQSVHYSGLVRLPYKTINIVFDEIELYFHPAFQRSFIKRLRVALQQLYLGDKTTITNLNIMFLTHSPFILSDIPKDNISMLKINELSGKSVASAPDTQTFAANINELLAGSFFLEGTLMGEYAEEKVNDLIKVVSELKEPNLEQFEILQLIGDGYLRNSLRYFLNRRNDQNRN
jgi:energy-coupling factor transporter ATP-binding protein EcfA2